MIEISEQVVSLLKSDPQLTAVVENRIFPMVGNEGVKFPFAIYNIGDEQIETKDAYSYPVNVFVWFEVNQKTEATEMRAILKQVIIESDFDFINTATGMHDDTGHVYAELNFKIIK